MFVKVYDRTTKYARLVNSDHIVSVAFEGHWAHVKMSDGDEFLYMAARGNEPKIEGMDLRNQFLEKTGLGK